MEQLASGSPPPRGSFGALLRGHRRRALLSQEQLAARAEVSERTVRDIEAGRVRSPRTDTVRLLADALQLTGPERESWCEAAWSMNHQRAGPPAPAAAGPARVPGDAPAQLPPGPCGHSTSNNDALTTTERWELAALRRENRRLREHVEILKQATAIVATPTR